MKPARQKTPADWMLDERLQRVYTALGTDQALFVGGCVRDWLLDRHGGDVDLATRLTPPAMQAALSAAQIKWIPTGIDHGTLTAVVEGASFEITTLRRDVETDGRHARIIFTEDWREDAQRRDFTINALYADIHGNVYDPLGQGIDDLAARRLRFVGDAKARIAEDYLRILRYFRFAAQLNWTIDDAQTLAACASAAPQIATLSKERITHEMLKLLSSPDPAHVLSLMHRHAILPALLDGYNAAVMARLASRHPMARLSLLNDPESHLTLSNDQKKHLRAVRAGATQLPDDEVTTIKRLIYGMGNDIAAEIYALWCAQKNKAPQAALFDLMNYWSAPIFPVKGEDLISQGYKPGPALGEKLRQLEEEWLADILRA